MKNLKQYTNIYIVAATLLLLPSVLLSKNEVPEAQPYVNKRIVIVQSTKDYTAANKTAVKVAKQLQISLKLRGLTPHPKTGLTYSSKECAKGGFDHPCYISRGRYDDGDYVSIEHSDAFQGFSKGYYIVVTASGNEKDIAVSLANAKKHYKDAYAKLTKIYIGCIH